MKQLRLERRYVGVSREVFLVHATVFWGVMKRFTRKGAEQRGSVFTEFAIIATFFFILLLGSLSLVRSIYTVSAVRAASAEGLRAGILGLSAAQIESVVMSRAAQSSVALTSDQIKVCPLILPNCATESTGGPNAYMRIDVEIPIQIIPGLVYNFSSTFQGKNEA